MRRIWILLCAGLVLGLIGHVVAQDDAISLPQEFRSNVMMLRYPAGWVVEDLEQVASLGTDSAAVQSGNLLDATQARATLFLDTFDIFNIAEGVTLDEAAEGIAEFTEASMPATCQRGLPIPDIMENDTRTVALFYECSQYDNLIFIRQVDDRFAMMVATIGKGGFKSLYAPLLAVMHTIQPPTDDTPTVRETTTYTNEDMNLTLELPPGWYVTDIDFNGNIFTVLVPVQNFEWTGTSLPDVPFAIFSQDTLSQWGISDDNDPAVGVLEYLNANSTNEFGEIVAFEYDGRSAAVTDADYDEFENRAIVLMIDDDNYMYLNIIAPNGMLERAAEDMLEIIATATLLSDADITPITTDMELTQTMISDDGNYAFDYPENWTFESEILIGNIEVEDDTRVMFGFREDPTIDSATEYLDVTFEEDDAMVTEGVETFTVNGQEVARLILTDSSLGIFTLYQYAIEIEEGVFLFFLIGRAPFDNPEFEETIFAMLTSVRVND